MKEMESRQIPLDLIIATLLKLPAKSIARFRCVSKLWESTFRSPYFTESFLTIPSSSRPKLLLACRSRLGRKMLFFSSPQPQSSCLTITANFQLSFRLNCPSDICRPVRGLVCSKSQMDRKLFAKGYPEQLICNPSTGQCLTLPKVKHSVVRNCLGYDPIDRQLKVLCMTQVNYGRLHYDPIIREHHVLTLGTGSWRMIKCGLPHFAVAADNRDFDGIYDWICINGVLYYLAAVLGRPYDGFSHIVCFDVRFEKFSYMKKAQDMEGKFESALVNYKGKLAMLQPTFSNKQSYNGVTLWVLEDAEKHQWLRHTYVLPSLWLFVSTKLRFAGMTNTGEIVWAPYYISRYNVSFFLVYYNPERNTVTRVGIQGMEAYENCGAYVFLDHIEDVKLMATI